MSRDQLEALAEVLLCFYPDEPGDASPWHVYTRYIRDWHEHGHSVEWEDSVWQ